MAWYPARTCTAARLAPSSSGFPSPEMSTTGVGTVMCSFGGLESSVQNQVPDDDHDHFGGRLQQDKLPWLAAPKTLCDVSDVMGSIKICGLV